MPNGSTNPIRALVFDTATVSQAAFRIDGAGTWFPMTRNASNPRLWEGDLERLRACNGSHKIEVQALGTTTRLDTINVTVAGTNSAPVAADDSYTTDQGTTLTVAAPGVLANDTDADGDALTASLVSRPAHGQLTLNTNGSFDYTPAAGYSGPDSFQYAAYDGQVSGNTATVSITVNAAAGDTVTVKTATFTRRTSTLAVTATSSAAGSAVLTVWNADQIVNLRHHDLQLEEEDVFVPEERRRQPGDGLGQVQQGRFRVKERNGQIEKESARGADRGPRPRGTPSARLSAIGGHLSGS